MKIYGPYTHKDGRQHIIKYDGITRTTQSYPRYLMEQKLKRSLLPTEEVDHKDENFSNNDINNFQILDKISNIKKNLKHRNITEELYQGICPVCNSSFSKPMRFIKHNLKQGKAGPFCSRSCATKYQYTKTLL